MTPAARITKPSKKLMTVEKFIEFVERPENADRWFELIRGEVIELPPPQRPHGFCQANVTMILGAYTKKRRKGYICNESGVVAGRDPDTVRGPDVALYEDAETRDEIPKDYGVVAPRVVAEIHSPFDRFGQFALKLEDYFKAGVALVWYFDPENREVTVFKPGQSARVLKADDYLEDPEVLPGFRCRVAEFFLMPGEKLPPVKSPSRKRKKK